MSLRIYHPYNLQLKGVAMSEIEGALLEYDSSYDTVYRAFFMLNGKDLEMRELIRSTIFRINVFGGENTK